MTKRIERVNSLLEHKISALISRDFDFPETLVTLTHVKTTGNLIEARAYISVMPEDKADHVVATLNRGISSIQKELNKMLNMRPIPKIIFIKDEEIAQVSRIEELLSKLKNEEK